MKIRSTTLRKWGKLRTGKDAGVIAEAAGFTPQTVRNALNTGQCTPKLFDAMADYYNAKAEQLKAAIK